MKTAPRNCRFLSLVVVELVLKTATFGVQKLVCLGGKFRFSDRQEGSAECPFFTDKEAQLLES